MARPWTACELVFLLGSWENVFHASWLGVACLVNEDCGANSVMLALGHVSSSLWGGEKTICICQLIKLRRTKRARIPVSTPNTIDEWLINDEWQMWAERMSRTVQTLTHPLWNDALNSESQWNRPVPWSSHSKDIWQLIQNTWPAVDAYSVSVQGKTRSYTARRTAVRN